MSRVRIGSCSGPADAALVRAAFEAHGIALVINAEHHASLLGGLGGSFVPLDILVAEEDAEQAAELLRDLREHDREGEPDDDATAEFGDDEDEELAAGASASSVDVRVDRRRRTGIVLLLAMCVTFGTAHMSTGAWVRGLGLAALEVLSIKYLITRPTIGGLLLVACVVTDLVGALWRVRSTAPRIPVARVRR